MKTKTERIIAYAIDKLESTKITLTEKYLGTGCTEDYHVFNKYRYTVDVEDIEEWSDWEGELESHSFRSINDAYDEFKKQIASVKSGPNECSIKQVFFCDGFMDDYEDDLDPDPYYTRSATYGDYSPSSPWNAPGMSVHDFI